LSEEDALITDWKFTYTLSPKYKCNNLPSTKTVTFMFENDTQGRWLTGFVISIFNRNQEEAKTLAKIKARNIAIIISLKVGNPVRENNLGSSYKLPGQERELWSISRFLVSRYSIFENLDLDITQGNIGNLMSGDKPLNERIYHAYIGLRAYQEELYEAVIIQFYQAIEKVGVLSHISSKYEPLRDVLSHPESQLEETIDKLKQNFPSDSIEYILQQDHLTTVHPRIMSF
jgi:hypothetical protein